MLAGCRQDAVCSRDAEALHGSFQGLLAADDSIFVHHSKQRYL
jgi:hypothetical protein